MRRETAAFLLGFAIVASIAAAGVRMGVSYAPGNQFLSGGTASSGTATILNMTGDALSCSLSSPQGVVQCLWTSTPALTGPAIYQPVYFALADGGINGTQRLSVQDGGNGGRLEFRAPFGNTSLYPDAGSSADLILGNTWGYSNSLPVWAISRANEPASLPQQALWDVTAFGGIPVWNLGTLSPWNTVWATAGNTNASALPDAGNPDGGSVMTYKFSHRFVGMQTASTTGSSAEIYTSAPMTLVRGDGTYGGFYCTMDFSVDYLTSSYGAVGLFNSNNVLGAVIPTTLTNTAFAGWVGTAGAGSVMQLCGNATGANAGCTLCSGTGYLIGNPWNVYRLTISAGQNSAGAYELLELKRLDDPSVSPCSALMTTTSQLQSTALVAPHYLVNNLGTTGVVGINSFGVYCQSSYL